jgi:hypothetical protein
MTESTSKPVETASITYSELLKAASCAFERPQDNTWRRKLRFIAVPQQQEAPKDNALGYGSSRTECSCARMGYQAFSASLVEQSGSQVLELTDMGKFPTCTHYIAISYCWADSLVQDSDPAYSIHTTEGIRQNRAPSNVLRRAIAYAAHRHIPFIWIDQECINQDDADEKEEIISCMDQIYNKAQYVVAMLTSTLTDEYCLAILGLERGKLEHITTESYFANLELAEFISKDRWFTRAWTYQEAITASKAIDMLFPMSDDLIICSGRLGSVVGRDLLVNIATLLREGRLFFHKPLEEICPTYKIADVSENEDLATNRLDCLSAYISIKKRHLTCPFDTVSILANLCSYRIRIEPAAARAAGISIWTSMCVQAILNGDMSPVLYYARREHGSFRFPQLNTATNSHPLSVSILMPTEFSVNSDFWLYRSRIKAISLVQRGALISGLLWQRSGHIDFRQLREKYAPNLKWQDWRSASDIYDDRRMMEEEEGRFVMRYLDAIGCDGQMGTAKLLFRILHDGCTGWNPRDRKKTRKPCLQVVQHFGDELRAIGSVVDQEKDLAEHFGTRNTLNRDIVKLIIDEGQLTLWKPKDTANQCLNDIYLIAPGLHTTSHFFTPQRELQDEREKAGHALMWGVTPPYEESGMRCLSASSSLMKVCRYRKRNFQNHPYRFVTDNWSIFNNFKGEEYLISCV